jgi:NCAIR mutase (PurE)-related protein
VRDADELCVGITVVNIDNGFGAAFGAARILRSWKKGG